MNEIANITELFKKFKLDEIVEIFEKIESEEIYKLLKIINKKINLVDQRPKKNNKLKRDFLTKLKNYFIEREMKTNFFDAIEFLESSYSSLLSKRSDIIGSFSSEYVLAVIFIDMHFFFLKFEEDSRNILKNAKNQKEVLEGINNLSGDKFFSDNIINDISKLITNNIKIECWDNSWFCEKTGIAVLPQNILEIFYNPEIIHTTREFNKKLYENTGLWDIVQELDFQFRLLEEEISFEKNNYIKISNINGSKLEDYAQISRERFQALILNNTLIALEMLGDTNQNLLLIEAVNFKQLLSINIYDSIEYLGLTVIEWIKCFNLLRSFNYMVDCPVVVSENDLIYYFELININSDKCKKFLSSLTFNKDSPDIFDSPIIMFDNNKYLIIPFGLLAPNFINIISSIISKKKLSFKDKGSNFENTCYLFFKDMEHIFSYKCTSPNLNIDDAPYQIDILLEWDNYIFIIECKNRSIPNTLPTSLSAFYEKMDEYTEQVTRFLNIIEKYPERFNLNISNKIIVPVILNSLPFSLDFTYKGIIYTDFSIVNRFFESKDIYLQSYGKKQGRKNIKVLHEQWNGEHPTAKDFYNTITSSYYISEAKGRIKSVNTEHKLDDKTIILERRIITCGEF